MSDITRTKTGLHRSYTIADGSIKHLANSSSSTTISLLRRAGLKPFKIKLKKSISYFYTMSCCEGAVFDRLMAASGVPDEHEEGGEVQRMVGCIEHFGAGERTLKGLERVGKGLF